MGVVEMGTTGMGGAGAGVVDGTGNGGIGADRIGGEDTAVEAGGATAVPRNAVGSGREARAFASCWGVMTPLSARNSNSYNEISHCREHRFLSWHRTHLPDIPYGSIDHSSRALLHAGQWAAVSLREILQTRGMAEQRLMKSMVIKAPSIVLQVAQPL